MSSDDDKTRIIPRKPKSSVPQGQAYRSGVSKSVSHTNEEGRSSHSEENARGRPTQNDPDRTRIQSASTLKQQRSPSSVAPIKASDKTVFQNRPAQGRPTPSGRSDPQQVPDDRTRMAPRTNRVNASGNAAASSDGQRTQVNQSVAGRNIQRRTPVSQVKTIPPSAMNTNSLGSSGKVLNQDGVPELLKDRFKFENVLGAGGMGVVYKAKDLLKVEAQDKDPYVAIKLLGDEFKSHPEAFIALQRESRKTQRIAHPNIVNVHDFDRDGDTVFMTMEFLEGKPLDKLISQYKTTGLPEEDAWSILQGISAALKHAHAENIIHSDFKPGNIFVTNKGLAKVFDFGIARAVAKAEKFEESHDDKTIFDAGNLGALTPAYASLEMLEGETPDIRDDIYALGCIAYEMFTGSHPFNRVHANEAMRLKMKAKRIPSMPKRQWKIIEQAIAFKREDRIASVGEFWDRLTRKKSRILLVSSFVGLIVIGLAGALAYQFTKEPQTISINEDDVRSEIERKFLTEQNTKDLNKLLEKPDFTPDWEERLWVVIENLRKLLGDDDIWLLEQKSKIFALYVSNINTQIEAQDFNRARELIANAPRYGDSAEVLAELLKNIEAGERAFADNEAQRKADEEKRLLSLQNKQKQQQNIVRKQEDLKQRNEAFDVALATVNGQLKCRTTIAMRDVDIAVNKLRELNLSRYQQSEPDLVNKLAACISKIGTTFPERAGEFRSRAIRTFPNNAVIANIKINPKDPCDLSLAGLGSRGSRATCKDLLKFSGEDLGRGPSLVVIPAKGSTKAFAIGKYEITRDDFNKFCKEDASCSVSTGNSKLPVTNVSSQTIAKYLAWLTRKTKRNYRLPKRSEWVYASRANSSKLDSNRNCLLDSRGIKKGGALIKASVGQQNPWGLVNSLGNARELVADGRSYAAVGGSFKTQMKDCIVTKADTHAGAADELTGFRVLREIK